MPDNITTPRKPRPRHAARTGVPYASATSGAAARDEITKILRRFGAEAVGFWDSFEKLEIQLAFTHRGQRVDVRASAKGWAQMYLKAHPWTPQRRSTRHDYEQQALLQGLIAVNSILRDWIKGQITAIECGILSFEAVFLPYMLTNTGETVLDRMKATQVLPPPLVN